MVTNVFVQVMVFVTGLFVRVGAPALGETRTVELDIHPLIGFVAVKVYTPAPHTDVTGFVAVPHALTPVHNTVAFVGVATLPVNVTDGEPQVNVWFDPALTPVGIVVFCTTTWFPDVEQLLVELVKV